MIADQKTVSCKKCGRENPSHSLYCGVCGGSLTKKCRHCWHDNIESILFCRRCGERMEGGIFGLSPEETERWITKLTEFGWKRQITNDDLHCLKYLKPEFDPNKEIIVIRGKIKFDGWLVKVATAGYDVFSTDKKKSPGSVILSNWRVIVLDLIKGRASSFLYENLKNAEQTRMTASKFPIFDIDFGNDGKVELVRSRMTELVKYQGFFSRLFLGPINAGSLDIATTVANNRLIEDIEYEQRENAMVVAFFQNIIACRDRLCTNPIFP